MPFPGESDDLDDLDDLAALNALAALVQVEKDDDADYRLPAEYLLWALQPPPYFPRHARPSLLHAGTSRKFSGDNDEIVYYTLPHGRLRGEWLTTTPSANAFYCIERFIPSFVTDHFNCGGTEDVGSCGCPFAASMSAGKISLVMICTW